MFLQYFSFHSNKYEQQILNAKCSIYIYICLYIFKNVWYNSINNFQIFGIEKCDKDEKFRKVREDFWIKKTEHDNTKWT